MIRTHLINAVVGRVAPRALTRELDKGWPSLEIGRHGARGATRPTIYEMASRHLRRRGQRVSAEAEDGANPVTHKTEAPSAASLVRLETHQSPCWFW
jgi:hypothetical protein